MNDSKLPRETIALGPGVHTFEAPDWCVSYRVHLKGGDAGTLTVIHKADAA